MTGVARSVLSEFVAAQPLKRFDVFRRGARNDIARKFWTGRSFVPLERFEKIAHELFVEAQRVLSDYVLVFGPEA